MIFIFSKVSDGNMDFKQGDTNEALENRKKFLSSYGMDLSSIIALKQPHGSRVTRVDKKHLGHGAYNYTDALDGDGLITNQSGIYLLVKVADCIPIGIYDPKHEATGLIHLGWRGLEKGIIKNTIKAMSDNFKSQPKGLIVRFGPSIGPCHYRMDIWKEAENQLVNLGVLRKNIDNPKICTYESEDYFSHRRAEDQRLPDFRFVTILGLC